MRLRVILENDGEQEVMELIAHIEDVPHQYQVINDDNQEESVAVLKMIVTGCMRQMIASLEQPGTPGGQEFMIDAETGESHPIKDGKYPKKNKAKSLKFTHLD